MRESGHRSISAFSSSRFISSSASPHLSSLRRFSRGSGPPAFRWRLHGETIEALMLPVWEATGGCPVSLRKTREAC